LAATTDSEKGEAELTQVFTPQFGRQVCVVAGSAVVLMGLSAVAIAYYWTPAYWRVGYQPQQPIQYSHPQHVDHLGLDCRYCHTYVDASGHANVPTTQVCMNCHGVQWGNIKAASTKLGPLREAWDAGQPVPWIRVHNLADYAYFHHAAHVARGVACVSCHARIDQMEQVWHAEPLSMSWCLDCHRNPEPHLRASDQVTNMQWEEMLATDANLRQRHEETVRYLQEKVGVHPPVICSGCHR
jgi:hypothetical protein